MFCFICILIHCFRFGRKKPLLVAVLLQLTAGVVAAYIPEYWTFTFMRFLVGLSVGGTMVTSFVIVMEFVGTQYRDTISALYQVPFNMGHMLLAAFGYFLRDFSAFQLAISVPAVLLLSYFFVVPETPRWLIAVKRTDEAIHILERVAKVWGTLFLYPCLDLSCITVIILSWYLSILFHVIS